MWKSTLQTPRSVEKQEEVLKHQKRDFFGSLWRRPSCDPAAHEVRGGAEIHLQLLESPTLSRSLCSLWRAHAGADSWQKLWPWKRSPHQEQIFWQEQQLGKAHIEQFLKDCIP